MNSYLSLACKFIKSQPKKTLLRCFAIILSTLIISIVIILNIIIDNNKLIQARKISGDYHAKFSSVNYEQLNILKNHLYISEIGIEKKLVTSNLSNQVITVDIGNYDEKALEMLNTELILGRLPQNDDEIVLEESLVRQISLKDNINQIVNISFPTQTYINELGGEYKKDLSIYYKLVGIIKNRPQDKFLIKTIGLVSENSVDSFAFKNVYYDVFIKVKDDYLINKAIKDVREDIGIDEKNVELNNNLINELNDNKTYKKVNIILIISVILAVSGMLSSVFYLFNINRHMDIAMLRAIGSTTQQIRKILLCEIFLLSVFCVPIGIFISIIALQVLVYCFSYFQNIMSGIYVDIPIIIKCFGLSYISILVSAIITNSIISKISINESLKSNGYMYKNTMDKNNIDNKKVSKLSAIGIIERIAYKNVWRNKKRAISTMVSLSISIIFFITISSITFSFNPTKIARNLSASDYIIRGYEGIGYSEEEYSKIASLEGIEKIYTTKMDNIKLKIKQIYEKNDRLKNVITNNDSYKVYEESYEFYDSNLYGYVDETLKLSQEKIIDGKIDIEKMKNNNIAVMVNNKYVNDLDLKVGDEISLILDDEESDEKHKKREVVFKIGAIISTPTIIVEGQTDKPLFIIHENIYNKYQKSKTYSQFNIDIIDNADTATLELLDSNFNNIAGDIPYGSVISFREQVEKYENYKEQINILLLSLAVIIIVIVMFSIMNTINIDLSLRLREFALLRAYGMTRNELKKAIVLEGVIYGVISSFWGCIAGTVITKIIFINIEKYITYVTWRIHFQSIAIAAVGCITLSVISSRIPLMNFHKISIVKSIKNER